MSGDVIIIPKARVVYPNCGNPALTSSSRFTHFVDAVGYATKMINHNSKTETISKLTIHNCCKTIFSPAKIYIL